eukprot:628359-Prorocentrum_minimum.AAC.1
MHQNDQPPRRASVRPGHGPFGPGPPPPPIRRREQTLPPPNVRQHLAPPQLPPEGHLRPYGNQEGPRRSLWRLPLAALEVHE